MAHKADPHGAAGALEEIDSFMERLASWIAQHWIAVALAVAGVLLAGAGWEILRSRAAQNEGEASNALDQVLSDYLTAMGAVPGTLDVPELANKQAAQQIRTEYVAKYEAVAKEHAGTLAAALARLEAADLHEAEGNLDAARTSLEQAIAEQPDNQRLVGLARQRVAYLLETRGSLAEAAAEHEAAAALPEYPLRFAALGDAARCHAEAGQRDRALALLERVESEAGETYTLPPALRTLLRELRAARS